MVDRIKTHKKNNEMIRIAKNTGYAIRNIFPINIPIDLNKWCPKYFKKSTISINKNAMFSVSKY